MSKFAYVTLLTSDTYLPGALVLANALKASGTAHKLVVLVTPEKVSVPAVQLLYATFDHVFFVPAILSKDLKNLDLLGRPELDVTFTKLNVWGNERLIDLFERVVFLDADTLPLRNVDELFGYLDPVPIVSPDGTITARDVDFAAAPDIGWPDCFNSGVFATRPGKALFEELSAHVATQGSFDGGDQGFLNSFFSSWSTGRPANGRLAVRLPFVFNVTPSASYSYLPAFVHYYTNVAIVHFIGQNKPWFWDRFTDGTVVPRNGAQGPTLGLINEWWKVFDAFKLVESLRSVKTLAHHQSGWNIRRPLPSTTPTTTDLQTPPPQHTPEIHDSTPSPPQAEWVPPPFPHDVYHTPPERPTPQPHIQTPPQTPQRQQEYHEQHHQHTHHSEYYHRAMHDSERQHEHHPQHPPTPPAEKQPAPLPPQPEFYHPPAPTHSTYFYNHMHSDPSSYKDEESRWEEHKWYGHVYTPQPDRGRPVSPPRPRNPHAPPSPPRPKHGHSGGQSKDSKSSAPRAQSSEPYLKQRSTAQPSSLADFGKYRVDWDQDELFGTRARTQTSKRPTRKLSIHDDESLVEAYGISHDDDDREGDPPPLPREPTPVRLRRTSSAARMRIPAAHQRRLSTSSNGSVHGTAHSVGIQTESPVFAYQPPLFAVLMPDGNLVPATQVRGSVPTGMVVVQPVLEPAASVDAPFSMQQEIEWQRMQEWREGQGGSAEPVGVAVRSGYGLARNRSLGSFGSFSALPPVSPIREVFEETQTKKNVVERPSTPVSDVMTYSPDEDEVSIGEGLTMTVKKTDRSAGAEEVDTLKEVTDVRLNSERVSMDTTTTISTSKETTAVVESGVSGSVKHSSAALYLLGESKELQTTSNTASVTASVTGDAALSDTSTLTTTVVESVTVEQSSSPTRLVEELVIGHAKPTTTTSVTEDGLAVEIRNVTEPADARSDRVEINAEDTTETNVTVESVEINSTGSTLKVHATEPVDVEKSTIGVTVTKNVTEDVTDVPTDVVTTLEEEKAHETAIVELTLTAVAEVESPVIDSAAVVENTVESSTLQIEDTEAREEIHVDASQVEIKKLGALSTAAASLESSTTEGHTVRKGSNGSAVVYEDVIDEGKIVSYAHEPGIFMENGDEVEYRWEVLLSGERVMRRIVRRRVIRTTTTTTTTTTRRTSMAGAGADEDGEVEIKEEIGPEGQKIVRRIIRRKVTRVVPGENTFTSVSGSSSTTDGGEDVEVREEIGPDGQKIIRRIIKRRIVKEASLTDTGSATGSVNGEDEVETKEDVGPDGRKIIRRIIKRKVVKEVPAESETVSMSSSSGAVRETNGDDEVEVKEEVGPDGQKFIRRIIRKKVVTRAPAETREATFSVTDLGSQHGNGSTSVSSATQVKATSTGTGTDDDVEVKEEIGPDGRTIIRRIIKKRVVIQVPESATTASTTSGDGEDDVEIKEIGPDGRKIIRRIITRRVVTASPQSIVSEGEAGASSSTSSTFASTEVAGADGEEVETTEETLPDGQRVVRKLIKRRAVQRATPEQVATSVARTADAGGNETVEVREEVGPDGTKIVRRIVKRRSIVRGSSATTASPQSPTRE